MGERWQNRAVGHKENRCGGHAPHTLPGRKDAMSFANRVAVITGASSGIGWAVAKELAGRGCHVGLIARRLERLQTLAQEIIVAGGKAAVAAADVGDRMQTLAAFRAVRQQLGPVDLLLANSGIGLPTPLEPQNVPQVESMFRINTLGVIYAIEAVLPEMLERGRGHLAAVSSLAAYKGLPGESAYCASKAAVNVYMEGLRIQLRKRGIAVTTICPGFIATPMTAVNEFKMPWLMSAEKAAKKIVRALERRRKVYNFPWQMVLLMKFTGWLPDWVIARSLAGKSGDRPPPPA
jgi:short-subunit dehydrogenase